MAKSKSKSHWDSCLPFQPSWPITPFSLFPASMCFSLDFTCN